MFSVLLSVYKKERPDFINQSLVSIYDDQILKPTQIVLVKDGSLTLELDCVVTAWQKKLGDVLAIVPLAQNVGLGAALNEGLKHCKHELVARMDTDDIALPERFAKQVPFMHAHPEIAASSAQLEEWDEELEKKLQVRTLPCEHEGLAKMALLRSPLSHPLTIFRKDAVQAVGGYPALRKAQDYALWSLLLQKGYKLANLPDVLLRMRTGSGLFERRGWEYFKHESELLRFQRKIGFLTYSVYLRNILAKGALRLSPDFVKRLAYKYIR